MARPIPSGDGFSAITRDRTTFSRSIRSAAVSFDGSLAFAAAFVELVAAANASCIIDDEVALRLCARFSLSAVVRFSCASSVFCHLCVVGVVWTINH